MAMFVRRAAEVFNRAVCSNLKNTEVSLDVCQPRPLLLPVRTKKRAFIPHSLKPKGKVEGDLEVRARAAGKVFQQEYMERPINISCTAGIFEAYVPPEGDARLSTLSKEGLKQRMVQMQQTAASQLAIRKIKQYDPLFKTKEFAHQAQEMFIEAHNALSQFNKEKLHSLLTERCYPEMTRGTRYKTIRWTFVESLEPPQVVHARCPDILSKDNLYGQVTVRMHSRQTLAIYDRFGRLMVGSEEQPKDVLEYLVMERHLINPYGCWRLHGKIVPSWAPPKDPIIKTVMIPGQDLQPGEEFEAINYEVPKPKAVQWHK
ncbi:39S ribosomal protein L45, mitochondrial [Thalassophryne amazonica]|uniref:39S ribosomal protein L45, mitochondrial n=1 Tax=Thalassophryne amazonica TaxID=390379 RepID=UPI001471B0DD|nr:39S ribosomal protein L45, mitochondrial [Thalassophryne amazonica]